MSRSGPREPFDCAYITAPGIPIATGYGQLTGRYSSSEVLAESAGRTKTLSEVAHLSGIPESSALRYLATLAGRGVVEHDGNRADSRYRLGIALFSLAERALGNTDVRALALPLMQGLFGPVPGGGQPGYLPAATARHHRVARRPSVDPAGGQGGRAEPTSLDCFRQSRPRHLRRQRGLGFAARRAGRAASTVRTITERRRDVG